MLVYVFRGPGRVFGVTEDVTGSNLPERFAPWAAFKSVELLRGESTPGLHVDECLDDLTAHGFHVTDAHVRITDQVV
ncbi:MAG: hypothetical protein JO142_20970 [Burkholderiales bacterium]|nr:hypothetical protein [Burkholderiales bacterium]